jgi:hypothetical protein
MQHHFFLKHANVIVRSAERNQLKTTPKSDMKQSSLDKKMLADILGFAWQPINKAQGQTLTVAGLNLTNSPFSHGQLSTIRYFSRTCERV